MSTNIKTKISIAHSPDADDAFMFYALSEGIIKSENLEFENILKDIQSLNVEALNLKYDTQAISFNAYPELEKDFQLLSCGGSLGIGYGPMVISKEKISFEEFKNLKNKKIIVPGEKTTAFLLLKLAIGNFEYEVIPFDEIINSVLNDKAKFGLIIHEGQLSYIKHGLNLILDLGKWWQEETNLPVPLGGNIIKRSLSESIKKEVNSLIKKSIQYGLENQEEVVKKVKKYARELENDNNLVDKFVSMYVNKYTVDYGEEGKKAIETLYKKALEKGFIKKLPTLDFVE